MKGEAKIAVRQADKKRLVFLLGFVEKQNINKIHQICDFGYKFSQATATKLSYPSETAELLGLRGFAGGTFPNDRINTGRTGFVVDREGRFCRSLLYCYPIPPEGAGKGGSSK